MKVTGSFGDLSLGMSASRNQARRAGPDVLVNFVPTADGGLRTRAPATLSAVCGTLVPTSFFAEPLEPGCVIVPKVQAQHPAVIMIPGFGELPAVSDPADPWPALLSTHGASAVTRIGKYVVAAVNSPLAYPATGGTDLLNVDRPICVVVEQAGYSKQYSMLVDHAGGTLAIDFTTPSSQYPTALDVTDLKAFTPDYQAASTQQSTEQIVLGGGLVYEPIFAEYRDTAYPYTVRDSDGTLWAQVATPAPYQREYAVDSNGKLLFSVNHPTQNITLHYHHRQMQNNPAYTIDVARRQIEYNEAVTAWITSAAEQSSLTGVANKIRDLCNAVPGLSATAVEGCVFITGATQVRSPVGGIRVFHKTVDSPDDLSPVHVPGCVVKVDQGGGAVYYMKAVPTGFSAGSTPTRVRWVESGRYDRWVDVRLVFIRFHQGALYAASARYLSSFGLPAVPTAQGQAGDTDSAAPPAFVGSTVSALAFIHDRLAVAGGSSLRLSNVGNYLDFMPPSVISPQDSGPLEFFLAPGDSVVGFVTASGNTLVIGKMNLYLLKVGVAATDWLLIRLGALPGVSAFAVAGDALLVQQGAAVVHVQPGEYAGKVVTNTVSTDAGLLPTPVGAVVTSSPTSLFLLSGDGGYVAELRTGQQGVRVVWWRVRYTFGSVRGGWSDGDAAFIVVDSGGSVALLRQELRPADDGLILDAVGLGGDTVSATSGSLGIEVEPGTPGSVTGHRISAVAEFAGPRLTANGLTTPQNLVLSTVTVEASGAELAVGNYAASADTVTTAVGNVAVGDLTRTFFIGERATTARVPVSTTSVFPTSVLSVTWAGTSTGRGQFMG